MTLQELGLLIKEKREAKGLSIEDVASRIKVASRILQNIDNGDLKRLPHAVYTKGFIRSYALLVGMDNQELTEALDAVFPPETLKAASQESSLNLMNKPSRRSGKKKSGWLLFIIILVLN